MVGRPHTVGARVYERLCLWNTESEHCSNNIKGKFHPRTGHKGAGGGERYSYTLSSTSAIDGVDDKRHALAALPPGKRSGTYCTGGRVGPTAGLDRCEKYLPHRDSIPGPSGP